ncbi:MAG: hypothetical protein AB1921_16725 [Thermodesulfobacteriota bacterium]
MKKIANVLLALTLAVLFYGTAQAGEPRRVQARQQQKIENGSASGRLTVRESRALQREQSAISARRHHAWADGRMTTRERSQIRHMQHHAGRHITCLRRNDRMRWGWNHR